MGVDNHAAISGTESKLREELEWRTRSNSWHVLISVSGSFGVSFMPGLKQALRPTTEICSNGPHGCNVGFSMVRKAEGNLYNPVYRSCASRQKICVT